MTWLKIPAGGPVDYSYAIAQDAVTNAEYAQWLNSLPSNEAALHYCRLMADHFFGGIVREAAYLPKSGFEKKPVVFVSWHDAQAYAHAHGGRLPTEAEWKKAAAWLPQSHRYAQWCTGRDESPTQSEANFYDFENGWALPAPHLAEIDAYAPNGVYGCRGMAGNVSEWVDAEMPNGWKKSLGGSLFRPVELCRIDACEGDHPNKRLSTFGFRIVEAV